MRLEIKNFQSITDASVDFPVGITVIQGESNNGKTALLRAVKAIITNPQGSQHYIQHGKNKAKVTLTNNGETLTWERNKSTTNYYYNNEEFTKCSKQSSIDFCDLGFVTDNKGKLMNLSDEWSVLFPFGYSDTELFKIFEDLFSIVDTNKVLEAMKGDETSCNRDKLLYNDRLNEVNRKKETIAKSLDNLDLSKPSLIKSVLNKKWKELEILRHKVEEATVLDKLTRLEVVSEPFKTDELVEIGKHILDIHKSCSRLSQLPVNVVVPNPRTFDFNLEVIGRVNKANLDYCTAKQNLESLAISQVDLENKIKELQAIWNQIDVCPLCGKDMK